MGLRMILGVLAAGLALAGPAAAQGPSVGAMSEEIVLQRGQSRALVSPAFVLTFRGRGCANGGYVAITLGGERDNCVAPGEMKTFEIGGVGYSLVFMETDADRTVARFVVAVGP